MKKSWMILCLMLICTSMLLAEDVWVKRRKLDLRAGKGAAYEVVATAEQGDKLVVVEREEKWIKVKTADGKEGYIFEESISPREVKKENMSFADSNASALSATAGGKGLRPGAEDWAKTHSMSTASVEKMISMRAQVTGKDYEQFVAEGNLK